VSIGTPQEHTTSTSTEIRENPFQQSRYQEATRTTQSYRQIRIEQSTLHDGLYIRRSVSVKTVWDSYGKSKTLRDIGHELKIVFWAEREDLDNMFEQTLKITGTNSSRSIFDAQLGQLIAYIPVEADAIDQEIKLCWKLMTRVLDENKK
jgi:hypothetical protein